MRMSIAIGALLLLPLVGAAQVPNTYGTGNSAPYAPNYYNRNTQPLSPYLNLTRGGNTAVNYFYGVRPGLMNGPFSGIGQTANNYGAMGRQTFFPQIDTLYELDADTPKGGIQPTGHPFGFNNTLSYFGQTSSRGGQGNQSPMGGRRSMMGGR